jgi:hypothetical protein
MRVTRLGSLVKTSVRGEAVDFDKYDSEGRPNPYHGWTLDFPDYVPAEERTYSNKGRAQGWYDDPENEPLHPGTRWGGTGDYADKTFHAHTQQYNREPDPNREEMIDPSGALGQYDVGAEDLNEFHEQGHHLHPGNQAGYPEGFNDMPGVGNRGIYSTNPDIIPFPGMERQRVAPAGNEGGRHLGPRTQYIPHDDDVSTTLQASHNHEAHDDTGNLDRVFGLWHGGSSYAHGYPNDDMESFPSLEDARRAVEGRYYNHNSGHGGEATAYDPVNGTHHLVGNGDASRLSTPAVDRSSGMEIYHAEPAESGGWHVFSEDEPSHHIWVNADGDAVVGRERGSYGDDEEDDDNYGYENDTEPGSHPVNHDLVGAGWGYYPHEYNGDRYMKSDSNGHNHVIRAPNPRYGAMDNWHYEFHPHNEGDSDPNARDASRDGPRSLSFHANSPEEAHYLYANMGSDLSELASSGYGIHKMNLGDAGTPGDPRRDQRGSGAVTNHTIEAHRRSANNSGYYRVLKNKFGWHAVHVPDASPENRFPPVTTLAQNANRRAALNAADIHDAGAP